MAFGPSERLVLMLGGLRRDFARTHSIRSPASQWNDLTNNKNPNMSANGISNSSRKMVNANSDSVIKNHRRSYSRFREITQSEDEFRIRPELK
jgi:hypothetical protein